MSEPKPFAIDLDRLKSRAKAADPVALGEVEALGETLGFVAREGRGGRRGRRPSPRTGQVHAKVMPKVAEEIAEEARRRGVTQGVLIEEAWALYRNRPRDD